MIAISRLRIQSQELPSSAVCRSQWTEMISVLIPVFSGFAVVMAIAPNETDHEESQLVPRQSHSSLMVQTAEIHRLTQRTGKACVTTIRSRDKHTQDCHIWIPRAPPQNICIHYIRLCVSVQMYCAIGISGLQLCSIRTNIFCIFISIFTNNTSSFFSVEVLPFPVMEKCTQCGLMLVLGGVHCSQSASIQGRLQDTSKLVHSATCKSWVG